MFNIFKKVKNKVNTSEKDYSLSYDNLAIPEIHKKDSGSEEEGARNPAEDPAAHSQAQGLQVPHRRQVAAAAGEAGYDDLPHRRGFRGGFARGLPRRELPGDFCTARQADELLRREVRQNLQQ